MGLYWLIINPIMQDYYTDNGDAVQLICFYMVYLSPLLMMWWSNLEQRLPMPKQMYLLPMQRSEQQEYIKTLMIMKISFPSIVGLVLQIVYGVFYGIDFSRVFARTTALVSFGIGMYVCSSLRSKFDRYIRYAVRGKDGTGKDAWLNWMCMIFSVICYLVGATIELDEGDSKLFACIGYIVILGIMIIMDIVIIKTRYEGTILDTCNYEEQFNVLSKVNK